MKKLVLFLCVALLICAIPMPAFAENTDATYEVLQNGDFEQNSDVWQNYYMAKVEYCDDAHTGSGAFKITNRKHCTDIARQYIVDPLEHYGQGKYAVSAWLRLADPNAEPIDVMLAVALYGRNGQNKYFGTSFVTVTSEWTQITGTFDLKWEGSLYNAEFYFFTPETNGEDQSKNYRDLLLDDCSMTALSYTGEPYAPEESGGGYEMLQNGGFEQNSEVWEYYYKANLEYCDEARTGNGALKITERQHSTDIVRQYITQPLKYYGSGVYEVHGWVRLADPTAQPVSVRIAVCLYCQGAQNYYFVTGWVTVTSEWTHISGRLNIEWDKKLNAAEFYMFTTEDVEGEGNYRDLILDDCSMTPVTFTGDPYVPEPETTEPVTTEPVTTEPVTTEPGSNEPVSTEPDADEVTTEPVSADPGADEVTTEPVSTEPDADEVTTDEPTEVTTAEEQPNSGIPTTTVLTIIMISVGVIMLGCAVALVISIMRGKK